MNKQKTARLNKSHTSDSQSKTLEGFNTSDKQTQMLDVDNSNALSQSKNVDSNNAVIDNSMQTQKDKIQQPLVCDNATSRSIVKAKKAGKISAKTLSFTALFAALVYATTMIAIPNGVGGIINFGDAMILVCATVVNPIAAMIAGSIGAALADLTLPGCAIWAPFTLVIKALMACACGLIVKAVAKFRQGGKTPNKVIWISAVLASYVIAELIMVVGYFGASYIISKFNLAMATSQFISNFIQMAIAVVAASILIFVCRLDILFDKIYKK